MTLLLSLPLITNPYFCAVTFPAVLLLGVSKKQLWCWLWLWLAGRAHDGPGGHGARGGPPF